MDGIKKTVIIDLPKEEYIHVDKDGRMVTYCTLRQIALHTIGLNSGHVGRRIYTRHGKKYYKPYRNYFCGNNSSLDSLVEAGYMEYNENIVHGEKQKHTGLTEMVLTGWVSKLVSISIMKNFDIYKKEVIM